MTNYKIRETIANLLHKRVKFLGNYVTFLGKYIFIEIKISLYIKWERHGFLVYNKVLLIHI